jgi:DNA repair exonuclease SbcCD nuclease subunit
MPQGRDINEAGPKSVTLVTVGDDRTVRIEEHVTSVAQFERVEVDLTGIADWRDMARAIGTAMEQAREAAISEHLVARLRLAGPTPLAWRIRRDLDLLKTEADERASVTGRCWVEKIEVECQAPGMTAASATNPVEELRRLIEAEVVGSPAYQTEVTRIADELRGQLPSELRGLLGSDEATGQSAVDLLVREGAEDVLARLVGGAEARG